MANGPTHRSFTSARPYGLRTGGSLVDFSNSDRTLRSPSFATFQVAGLVNSNFARALSPSLKSSWNTSGRPFISLAGSFAGSAAARARGADAATQRVNANVGRTIFIGGI